MPEEYDPSKDPTPIVAGGGGEALPFSESRAQKLRIMLALAMGVAGIGLVGSGGYLMFNRLAPALERHRGPVSLSEGMAPDPRAYAWSPDSFPTTYPAPSAPLGPRRRSPVPDSAGGPTTPRQLRNPDRPRSYFEAYADARAEMDEGLGYINFQRVFAPSHLWTPESLRVTRRMVQAAANVIRVYRGREVMAEQTYGPDDPTGPGALREPFETAEATRVLLSDVDSLFGVLIGQDGHISVTADGIRFADPAGAAAYAELRQQVISLMADWADSAESKDLVTMPRIIRALGPDGPPPLRN